TFLENNTLPRNWVIFYFCIHVCCTATSACICERIFCIPIGSESHFIINYYRVDYWSHHLRNFIRSYGTDSIYQAIFVRIRYPIFHHAISRFFSHFTRTSSSTRVRFSWTSSCLAGYISEEIEQRSAGVATGLYISSNALGGMIGRVMTGYLTDHFSWQTA